MKNALLGILVLCPLLGLLSCHVVTGNMSFFSDALGHSAFTGTAIDYLRLWNIAVEDHVVYYYLYYDAAGYVGIAYDDTETVLADQKDTTMTLVSNKNGEQGMWYIIYYLED